MTPRASELKEVDDGISLVDPTGRPAPFPKSKYISARSPVIEPGMRVGFLSNGKPNVDLFCEQIFAGVVAAGANPTLKIVKRGPVEATPNSEIAALKESADIVIIGVADGGTATSWGVYDALELASHGVATCLVCTSPFVPLARSMLDQRTPPSFRLIEIPHPFTPLLSGQVADLAQVICQQISEVPPEFEALEKSLHEGVTAREAEEDVTFNHAHIANVEDETDARAMIVKKGWCDGLAFFLPTAAAVNEYVGSSLRKAEPKVSVAVPPRNAVADPYTVASNAIMAGMPKKLLPFLDAALRAASQAEFNLLGLQTTTNPVTPVVVVGGPGAEQFGFNYGAGSLGPGNVSNASLGRALRLCLQNIGGATVSDSVDPATQGQPGKYTFCFHEQAPSGGWPSLAAQINPKLVSSNNSTVSLIPGTGSTNLIIKNSNSEEFLIMLAESINNISSNDYMFGGVPLLVLCPEHAAIFHSERLTLDEIKSEIFERTKIPLGRFIAKNREMMLSSRAGEFSQVSGDTLIPMTRRPHDFLICVSGGSSMHSTFIPSFGGARAVTTEVWLQKDKQ